MQWSDEAVLEERILKVLARADTSPTCCLEVTVERQVESVVPNAVWDCVQYTMGAWFQRHRRAFGEVHDRAIEKLNAIVMLSNEPPCELCIFVLFVWGAKHNEAMH